ncbi:hypothetical protein [uncultured Tateyamaria sp.]|uniref:hypothetical protein n=1 Tax=uncultured Tateyamaria sp. TaxID=455651 RepID=UPI00263929BB|nr:hypothetical protein [uncultured Tateyamaria sp.]
MRFEIVGKDDAESGMCHGRWAVALRALCLCAAIGYVGLVAMTPAASANQRQYAVVALTCDADLRLCRALVQVLMQTGPRGHLYRINPDPKPPQAFDLRLETDATGAAHLAWPSGNGDPVARQGRTEAEFARHIVAASPGLPRALKHAL